MYTIKKLEWRYFEDLYLYSSFNYRISTDILTDDEHGVWNVEEPLSMYRPYLFSGTLQECKDFMQNYHENIIKPYLEPM